MTICAKSVAGASDTRLLAYSRSRLIGPPDACFLFQCRLGRRRDQDSAPRTHAGGPARLGSPLRKPAGPARARLGPAETSPDAKARLHPHILSRATSLPEIPRSSVAGVWSPGVARARRRLCNCTSPRAATSSSKPARCDHAVRYEPGNAANDPRSRKCRGSRRPNLTSPANGDYYDLSDLPDFPSGWIFRAVLKLTTVVGCSTTPVPTLISSMSVAPIRPSSGRA